VKAYVAYLKLFEIDIIIIKGENIGAIREYAMILFDHILNSIKEENYG